ncbi:hypothetical protein EON76_02275 [bacterium]|nr:MAG: hypothetical protein EON76_02275 [bacterium]
MKNTDVAAIILIASISMLVAYFVASAVIGAPGSESVKVKSVNKISSNVEQPDKTVFNNDAINPTVEVIIGDAQQAPASNATGR